MNKSVLKSVFGGIIMGAALFFAGPLLLLILVLKFIFTPFGMGRLMYMRHGMGYSHWGMHSFAFADKVRSMSEEEYQAYQSKVKEHFYNRCGYEQKQNNSTL